MNDNKAIVTLIMFGICFLGITAFLTEGSPDLMDGLVKQLGLTPQVEYKCPNLEKKEVNVKQ